MSKRNLTLYEILGIKPNAMHNDVGLAFNRLMSAGNRADIPPNLKSETKLREAFAVLSDLDRRAEYDEQLRKARLKPAFGKNHAAMAALFVVAVGAGLYWHLRPKDAPPMTSKPYQEILNGAIPAVGRLQTTDLDGKAQPAGLAFAVEEGVLVTSCQGLSPTAQLTVNMAPRVIPARVTLSDEDLGLCKLEVADAGAWPLSVSSVPAKRGDRVYATHLGSKGEVSLRQGVVKSVKPEGKADEVEIDLPLMPQHGGAPLLDIYGRVVAVANMPPEGKARYVAIPVVWGETLKPVPGAPAQPTEEPAQEGSKSDLPQDINLPGGRKMTPERRAKLEKAFRPPPNVPSDL